jgi:hypothetical protein
MAVRSHRSSQTSPSEHQDTATLCRVALVTTDGSEDVSSPSSRFLTVIGFKNRVTERSLLLSLTIEGHCLRSKSRKPLIKFSKALPHFVLDFQPKFTIPSH